MYRVENFEDESFVSKAWMNALDAILICFALLLG